jgi:HK97 family phage major capsid protein
MQMTLGDSPLWLPGGQLRDQPYSTLMGKPIHFIEQASSVGTVGDLMLLDLSQYITIKKGGMKVASSIHVLFTTDEMAFRFILRLDGQPAWHSALTPYKGTNTLSPFVTVATRS